MLLALGHPVATCCDMLGWVKFEKKVKFLAPELTNAGPAMLGHVALKCCYRLAGLKFVCFQEPMTLVSVVTLI